MAVMISDEDAARAQSALQYLMDIEQYGLEPKGESSLLTQSERASKAIEALRAGSLEDGEGDAVVREYASELLQACEAVLECEMGTDAEGKAYLMVPARSLQDLGAEIRTLVDHIHTRREEDAGQ
jgi:hypothetical protein